MAESIYQFTAVDYKGDEVNLSVETDETSTVVEWFNGNDELIGEDFTVNYIPSGDEVITVIGFNAGGCADTAMIQLIEYQFDFIECSIRRLAGKEKTLLTSKLQTESSELHYKTQ